MINLVKTISTEIISFIRVIKVYRLGKTDVRTAEQAAPYGIDSNPIKNMRAVYMDTGTKGNKVIVGYINKNQIAAIGESRLFSTDEDGELMFSVHLKADGTLELNGNSDNLVRFLNTKAVIEEIQDDIASLKQAFSTWTPVPNDGGAALKTAAASWIGAALTENIDDSKIDEIKVS